jgi:hypothetical protein
VQPCGFSTGSCPWRRGQSNPICHVGSRGAGNEEVAPGSPSSLAAFPPFSKGRRACPESVEGAGLRALPYNRHRGFVIEATAVAGGEPRVRPLSSRAPHVVILIPHSGRRILFISLAPRSGVVQFRGHSSEEATERKRGGGAALLRCRFAGAENVRPIPHLANRHGTRIGRWPTPLGEVGKQIDRTLLTKAAVATVMSRIDQHVERYRAKSKALGSSEAGGIGAGWS